MTIERAFEVVTAVPPGDAIRVLKDLTKFLPTWSIYGSAEKLDESEADVILNIAGNVFPAKVTLEFSETGRDSGIITVRCRGPVNMTLRMNIEPRGLGTLITGTLVVKAGFFRERLIATAINSFVENLRDKLTFELPSIIEGAEVEKKEAVELEEERAPEKVEKEVKPPLKVIAEEVIKAEKEIKVTEDPRELEDEIKLSLIVLKSSLLKSRSINISPRELFKVLKELLTEHGESLYVNIKTTENLSIKILIGKDGKVSGVRTERPEGEVLNGLKALELIASLEKIEGRLYVFKIPEGVI